MKREADAKRAGEIWMAIDILMGLRYEREQIDGWLKGVRDMEESVTYQAIVEKGVAIGEKSGEKRGAALEARKILMRLGTERFGKPSDRVLSKLNKISDDEKLEDLVMKTQVVSSWRELLNQ